ncbi:MAG: hypothetical protein ACETWM_12785 [Candidatus Lokiarchaeia archaeon]
MKTKIVTYLLGFVILFLLGVLAASVFTYGMLLSTGPLIFLYPVLVRFSPMGIYIKILYIDSFPLPALALGYESLLTIPVNYPLYLGLFYTGAIAIIMSLAFSIPILLIRPLSSMPEYEYFHDASARVQFLVRKNSWKKRLTIIFIIIILIIIYLIGIFLYMGLFQILHLTYIDTFILGLAALPLLLFLILFGDRLFIYLYRRD